VENASRARKNRKGRGQHLVEVQGRGEKVDSTRCLTGQTGGGKGRDAVVDEGGDNPFSELAELTKKLASAPELGEAVRGRHDHSSLI